MNTEIDIEKNYNEFWKEIIENKDGTINKEQLKKELSDYSVLMKNMSELFCHITGGKVGKQFTEACVVKCLFDDEITKSYDEGYADCKEELK